MFTPCSEWSLGIKFCVGDWRGPSVSNPGTSHATPECLASHDGSSTYLLHILCKKVVEERKSVPPGETFVWDRVSQHKNIKNKNNLQQLYLYSNEIGDEGAKALAGTLPSLINLQELRCPVV